MPNSGDMEAEYHGSPDESMQAGAGSHQWSQKLVISDRALAWLSGVSIAVALFAVIYAVNAEREARMLEYYLLELDAKVIASGIKRPEDSIANKLKREK